MQNKTLESKHLASEISLYPYEARAPFQDSYHNWWLTRKADVSAVLQHSTTVVDQQKQAQIQRVVKALGRSYPELDTLFNMINFTNGDKHLILRKHASQIVRDMHAKCPKGFFVDQVVMLANQKAQVEVVSKLIDPCLDAWRRQAFGLEHQASRNLCLAVDQMLLLFSMGIVHGSPERLNAASAEVEKAYRHGMNIWNRSLSESDYARLTIATAAMGTLQGFCANILTVLAKDQSLQDNLRQNPELMPQFLNEAERTCNPFRFLFRNIGSEELYLMDTCLTSHSRVIVDLGSANRDPDIWEEPNRFDITRPIHPNLAFSDGAHRCLGIHATRLFVSSLLEVLLSKFCLFPTKTTPVWTTNWILHNPLKLPLIIEPL